MYKNATGGRGFGGTAKFSGGRLISTTPRMSKALKAKTTEVAAKKVRKAKPRTGVTKNPEKFRAALEIAIGKKSAAAYIRKQRKNPSKPSQP